MAGFHGPVSYTHLDVYKRQAPYIVQKAGEAVYSEAGKAQLKEQVAYYMKNAAIIYEGLKEAGYNVSGGVNAPYIWLETPKGMTSWEFFDYLLERAVYKRQPYILPSSMTAM